MGFFFPTMAQASALRRSPATAAILLPFCANALLMRESPLEMRFAEAPLRRKGCAGSGCAGPEPCPLRGGASIARALPVRCLCSSSFSRKRGRFSEWPLLHREYGSFLPFVCVRVCVSVRSVLWRTHSAIASKCERGGGGKCLVSPPKPARTSPFSFYFF